MSKISTSHKKVTIHDLSQFKADGKKISMVTCYDASFAKIVNKSNINTVLVGDSLGNVMLGHENTTTVTMDHMIHHCRSVANALDRAWLIGDMPFMSYKISTKQALTNAARLVSEGGVQAVKVEGPCYKAVKKISEAGIPVVAHLGLTPQSIHAMGGYRVQAKSKSDQEILVESAVKLEEAGACMLVLEMVPETVAQKVTSRLSIPTVGIGAGRYCDGQVLVLQDMLGFDDDFQPKFLKRYAAIGKTVLDALNAYHGDIDDGLFPEASHCFSGDIKGASQSQKEGDQSL